MAETNSISRSELAKQANRNRPKGFPLTAAPCLQWQKKATVNGRKRTFYFGTLDKPEAALRKYQETWHLLKQGIDPKRNTADFDPDNMTVEMLCNKFLDDLQNRIELGDIKQGSYRDYLYWGQRLCDQFGKLKLVEELRPDDFQRLHATLAKFRDSDKEKKPAALATAIVHIRRIFNWAAENYYIRVPLAQLWGSQLKRPSKKKMRESRTKKAASREEIQTVLDAASPEMKAAILIGINCGAGNTDIATLKFSDIDLQAGTFNKVRSKTGVRRKSFLFPETVAAIKDYIENHRGKPKKADADFVFITAKGAPFVNEAGTSEVGNTFSNMTRKLKVRRIGFSFYSLRHTANTIAVSKAGGHGIAIKQMMGHTDPDDMTENYCHEFDEDGLRKISKAIRNWLFNDGDKDGETAPVETESKAENN